jgi:hypothetical protein
MRHPFPRRVFRAAVATIAALAVCAGAGAGVASADTPNANGVAHGNAHATPVNPSYDAPRPAGAGTGRRIG